MSANSLTWLSFLVFYQWYKQTICLIYFTEIIPVSFGIGPVNKCRQYLLAILLGLLRDNSLMN